MISIRAASSDDTDAIWGMLEPVVRAGEVFTQPRGMNREEGLAYWFAPAHSVFVAEIEGRIAGSYYLRANQQGGGAHVANCGYMSAGWAAGRGVARTMCEHSLALAKDRGFCAMQFNFVVSTNEAAVHLWRKLGFEIVGRLPGAFLHPRLGYVDALVMFRPL